MAVSVSNANANGVKSRESRASWDAGDLRRFLAYCRDGATRGASLWTLLLGAECTLGEALALRWSDVNFADRSVTIAGTTPRTVALTDSALVALRRQYMRQSANRQATISPDDLVFPNAHGERPSMEITRRIFQLACDEAGVPALAPSDLRRYRRMAARV